MSGSGADPHVNLHIYGITEDGKLWHASRPFLSDGSAGSWNPWEEVKAKGQNESGLFVSVDSVSTWRIGGPEELHVLGITQDGTLWYTSRVENQDWQPFENLSAQIEGDWGKSLQVGVTISPRGQLDAFVIVQTKQGEQRILHTSRLIDGTIWEKFEDINQSQLAGFPGSFISVDCAYIAVGLLIILQVCGITKDGKLWHTLHCTNPFTNLRWLPFVNVQRLSRSVPTPFANVSLAQGADSLDVCVQSKGNLWHTSRFSDNPPEWQSAFDNISKEAAGKPGTFGSISCGDVNDTLHACGITQDGKIWHTSRTSTNPPVWQAFEIVTAVIDSLSHFIVVCVANITFFPLEHGKANPICQQIALDIGNNRLHMRGASTKDRASLENNINTLTDQGRKTGCPGF